MAPCMVAKPLIMAMTSSLADLAGQARDIARRHPWLAGLMQRPVPPGPNGLRYLDYFLGPAAATPTSPRPSRPAARRAARTTSSHPASTASSTLRDREGNSPGDRYHRAS